MEYSSVSGASLKNLTFKASLAIEALASARRYILAMIFYSSPRKLLNILRCEVAKRRGGPASSVSPFVLTLDATNSCNLRCPYCLTGKRLSGRAGGEFDLALLRKVLDEAGDYFLLGNIGNWGEPFLGSKIAEVVRELHTRRIFTTISSNFSLRQAARVTAACDAGLDYLILSIDGTSQAIYEKYRRKGRFELVLENTRNLIADRKAKRRATPIIEWQYLRFSHNAHEIGAARAMARQLGVDVFRVVPGVAPNPQPSPARKMSQPRASERFCQQLWHVAALNADGGIAPCCYIYKKDEDFGDARIQTLREIRAGPRYQLATALFRSGRPARDAACASDPDHPCLRCEVFLRSVGEEVGEALEGRIIGRRFMGPGISS